MTPTSLFQVKYMELNLDFLIRRLFKKSIYQIEYRKYHLKIYQF